MGTILNILISLYIPKSTLGEKAKNRGFLLYNTGSFLSVSKVEVSPIFTINLCFYTVAYALATGIGIFPYDIITAFFKNI